MTTNEMTPADLRAVMGNNDDFGFGGGGAWWFIFLFFAMMFGWGGNFGGQNNFGAVQQGFDQAATLNGFNTLNQALANSELNSSNQQSNLLQSMNGLAMNMQNCCCENRAATADLKYTIATEACADRAAVTAALQQLTAQTAANTQRILDQMCQDKIDAKNEQISNLRTQLQMAQLAASQTAQTAAIEQFLSAKTSTT